MKTLVVLSALVAATIAAPTLSELGFGPNQITETEDNLHFAKREKKSIEATEDLHASSLPEQSHQEASETSARTLFKKPIIIKKTKGHHHLYRDSEEEKANAESGETCRKEVKVKICDAASLHEKHNNKMITDGDMHQSIKMAKEAVENLQKDLHNLEHWNVKDAETKVNHFGSGKDAEMHTDIEKARQALEHFQNNFEALESIQTSSSMMKDAEALEDAQRQLSEIESETQRLAHWKEAMDNIKKNTEIVQNIENSLKSAQVNMPASSNLMKSEKVETEGKHAEGAEREMEVLASEHNEMRINKNIAPNQDNMRADAGTSDIQSTSHLDKKKNEEQSSKPTHTELNKKDAEEFEDMTFMKASEKKDFLTNTKLETPTKLEKTEESKSHSRMEGKGQDIEHMENQKITWHGNDKTRSTTEGKEQDNKPMENQKTAWHENDKADSSAKLSVKNEAKLNHELDLSLTSDSSMKSAKEINRNLNVQKIHEKENEANSHIEMKAAEKNQHVEKEEQTKEANNVNLKEAEHNDMVLGSSNIKEHVSVLPMDKMVMKEAVEVKAESLDHDQTMRMEFIPKSEVASLSLVNTAHPSEKKVMAHGKSANIEVAGPTTFQMKDSASKSLLDQSDKWKQDHNQASRGAYGLGGGYGGAGSIKGVGSAAYSSGTGAVGVFPNAKVGGCAIPLLLSCSPSVVSGSLAHSGGYSAPAAYRAGDDMKFHKKRDAKKENKQITKIKRTPTRIIEKIPYSYDKRF